MDDDKGPFSTAAAVSFEKSRRSTVEKIDGLYGSASPPAQYPCVVLPDAFVLYLATVKLPFNTAVGVSFE